MRDGFINVSCVSPEMIVADTKFNTTEICKEIDKPILLHFVGGEPSLYDLTNVLKIIDNDKKCLKNISFV